MTETTGLSSLNPINGTKKPGSVGLPQALTEVRILQIDTSGTVTKECNTNETGEICISSPGVNLGNTYLKPVMNKGLYVLKRYLRSGDLGRKDKDGYIWITGRAKDLINAVGVVNLSGCQRFVDSVPA